MVSSSLTNAGLKLKMLNKLIDYIKFKLALRKRMKEVRKTDPFIYK